MISTGQAQVPASGTQVCIIPPGPCQVVISNGGTGVVYVGAVAGGSVTTLSGVPIPSGGVLTFTGFQGGAGSPLAAIAAGGTSSVGFLISRAAGNPNPGIF